MAKKGVSLGLRCGRCRMSWANGRQGEPWRDVGPVPPPAPPGRAVESRVEQLHALVAVLDAAAAAQPLADEVVAACGERSALDRATFRLGGQLQVTFYRLRLELDELALADDLDDLRDAARRLLLYHQWMLREALARASSVRRTRAGVDRCRINGLGAPADRLRDLRDSVRALIA
jgi:hypothetical protein